MIYLDCIGMSFTTYWFYLQKIKIQKKTISYYFFRFSKLIKMHYWYRVSFQCIGSLFVVLYYHALTCKQTFVHVLKNGKFCNDVSRIYHLSFFAYLGYCRELNYDQYFICFFIVIFHEKMFPFLCYSPRSKKSRLLQHVNRKIEMLF